MLEDQHRSQGCAVKGKEDQVSIIKKSATVSGSVSCQKASTSVLWLQLDSIQRLASSWPRFTTSLLINLALRLCTISKGHLPPLSVTLE